MPESGLDLRCCPMGKNYGSHQFLNWWQRHPTGVSHWECSNPFFTYQQRRRGHSLSFFIGAGNRTRTCTVTHWNLNPTCLPIPPCPHMLLYLCFLHGEGSEVGHFAWSTIYKNRRNLSLAIFLWLKSNTSKKGQTNLQQEHIPKFSFSCYLPLDPHTEKRQKSRRR